MNNTPTPRTDSEIQESLAESDLTAFCNMVDFARTMERELADAKAALLDDVERNLAVIPSRDPDRVRLVAAAMDGILTDPSLTATHKEYAKDAVAFADACLAEMDKPRDAS